MIRMCLIIARKQQSTPASVRELGCNHTVTLHGYQFFGDLPVYQSDPGFP